MLRRLSLSLLLSVILLPASVAGVILEFETRDMSGDPTGTPDRLFAQGGMLRMEPGAAGAAGYVMIFRADEMLVLENAKKKYYRMDQATVQQLTGQLDAAMKQMEDQLAAMPAEQREMVEKMMKGKLPGGAIPEMTIEEEGSETVGGYSCRKYGVYADGEKTSEVFTTKPETVEGADEAMESFRNMARFTEKLFSSFQRGPATRSPSGP